MEISQANKNLVLRAIKNLAKKGEIVTTKKVMLKTKFSKLTALKYIHILEAEGKIKTEKVGNTMVIRLVE